MVHTVKWSSMMRMEMDMMALLTHKPLVAWFWWNFECNREGRRSPWKVKSGGSERRQLFEDGLLGRE